jgi:hypothetical protein
MSKGIYRAMTEANYHKDTSNHMVHEPGRMPYNSTLTEVTRVDDYVPKKEQIQFVEINIFYAY